VQFLPQWRRQLLARRQALLRVHPIELAFDVVDPANAFDRRPGYLAGGDQLIELAPGMCVILSTG